MTALAHLCCVLLAKATLVSLLLSQKPRPQRRVQVLVLGDLGRSPRMQYHASSLAALGWQVDLIGYRDSVLPDALANLHIVPLPAYPSCLTTSHKLLFLLCGPLKVLFQVVSLFRALWIQCEPAEFLLVQNPPSIPTLAVALLVCWTRRQRLIIDWHNFGYSLLALRLSSEHPLVTVSKWYERGLGRLAHANICVTAAMAKMLDHWGFRAQVRVVHDRPAAIFQPLNHDQRQAFRAELSNVLGRDIDPSARLIVSATSWTDDEDFSLLLHALLGYTDAQLPRLLLVITGKGPNRQQFEARVAQLEEEGRLKNVQIVTHYFDRIDDYALLLGAADLGISLHTSSSGVDLPMKVVDMFGAGLPVLGWSRFPAWSELVRENVNGCGFQSSEQLLDALKRLLNPLVLEALKKGTLQENRWRWQDEWSTNAASLFCPRS